MIDDAAWNALEGRQIVLETSAGTLGGELLRSEGDTLVLVHSDGEVLTVPKAEALSVRVDPAGGTAPPSGSGAPDPDVTQRPGSDGSRDESDESAADPEAEDGELTPAQARRKDRRDEREHAVLGAFTMHGITYSHWRGDGVNAGGASYAMDWGLGANLSPKFGLYAMAGGLLGAKIDEPRMNANYGHVAFVLAFNRKYFLSTIGAGIAFSRLRLPDQSLQRDRGLSVPIRLVGKIPLPHKLYLGVGLTYDLGVFRGFRRAVNGIGAQIVVGRW